jgi:hypothetical protein
MAIKKRPRTGRSRHGAAHPISVCMRRSPQQIAAAKRDDMPGTVA